MTWFASPAKRYSRGLGTWHAAAFITLEWKRQNTQWHSLFLFSTWIGDTRSIFMVSFLSFVSTRILVNMDDNIIEHYTNQSAFLIEISEPVIGQFQVTLSEVWESRQSPAASLNHDLRALLSRYSRNCEWLKPKRTKVPNFRGFCSSKKVGFSIL